MDKNEIKAGIQTLIDKYEKAKQAGGIKSYTEEDTKKGFIQPLFRLLEWDISDRNEVTSEENISGKRVDYGFYLNGRPQFYLEAKKFSININDIDFANQAVSYAWNKGATWTVLTNFENLKIFNAEDIKRSLADKLFKTIHYTEYLSRLDELLLLSKSAIANNLLNKEAARVGKIYQRIPVSDTLYKDLDECRDILTKSFIACNPQLKNDPDLLDEGVQKLLDRLIFLRVAEDRGVEPNILKILTREAAMNRKGNESLYQAMTQKFRELDVSYNSNLFSKHPFEQWDEFGGATEKAIEKLYGKKGYYEYDFKIMPADVLGTVYEHYLAHRLSKSRKGITLDKDAKKRKEQGIYYTPDFVVDYIVRHALQPVLDKCKSIDQLLRIKVLDPACGSGSFLIKALEILSKKYKQLGKSDEITKLIILTQNLYGVDLDEKAVEIARLNLCINSLDRKTKLPFLTDNIKCGNSLISGTDEELKKYFGKNYRDKKPFNWQEEFPGVFKQGGFDVVIGNPPYIFARGGNFNDSEKQYYGDNYKKLQQYQLNTFLLFIERAYSLLKENGMFGFIIPNNWLTINSFSKLREFLLKNTADLKIINAVESVFNQASVDTCLLIFRKANPTEVEVGELRIGEIPILSKYSTENFYKNDFVINISQKEDTTKNNFNLISTVELGTISQVSTGLKAYQIGKGSPPQDEKIKTGRVFHSDKKENKTYKPYLQGVDVKRYHLDWSGEYLSYGDWLAEPRKSVPFDGDRILVRQIPSPLPYCVNGVFTDEEYLNDINSMVVSNVDKKFDIKYILAVLNSRFISYWFAKTFDKFQRKIFPQFKVNELARFPIYKADSKQQKIIIDLVDKMLSLQKELREASENSEKWNSIKSEIEKTDHKIDQEVYKLYDLTPEKISIVESGK